jgi:hypothetical protein
MPTFFNHASAMANKLTYEDVINSVSRRVGALSEKTHIAAQLGRNPANKEADVILTACNNKIDKIINEKTVEVKATAEENKSINPDEGYVPRF